MGVHYFNFGYDENADICEELTPFQLMYIDNKLNGFVWQHNAQLTGFSSALIFFFTLETGDRIRCDPETLCIQTYHVIC